MAAMSNEVAMKGLDTDAVGNWPPGTAAQAFDQPTDNRLEQITNNMRRDLNLETADMERIYHQDKKPLSQRTDLSSLWQFPNPDSGDAELHKMHPIGKMFHKNYDLIKKHWAVDPQQVVPDEMRAQTPYSQALFLALRRLASSTKKDYQVAQEALLSVWRDRVGTPSGLAFDKSGMQFFQTQVGPHFAKTGNAIDNNLETVIQETNYGLTLQDALTAGTLGRKFTRVAKAERSQPGGKLRGGASAAQRADTRDMRKQKKEQKAVSREAELQRRQKDLNYFAGKGPASDSKISKKKERKQASKMRNKVVGEKGYKLLQFLQGDDKNTVVLNGDNSTNNVLGDGNAAPPNSPEPNTTQPLDAPEQMVENATDHKITRRSRNHGASSDPAVANYANNTDRHNDRLLSQMFNRVDVDSQRKLKAKKEKKLMQDVSQRQGSLPSDRVKLAELPTLHAQQGSRRETEALEGLAKVALKTEEQAVIGKSVFAGALGGGQREVIVLSDDDEL